MCQYNLLITDKAYDNDLVRSILVQNGFGCRALVSESLLQILGNDKRTYLTTAGQCDCGSIIGSGIQVLQTLIEKERAKLRKMRWSEAKIVRHIANGQRDRNKNLDSAILGNEAEELRWVQLSEKLLHYNIKFGILFHHFKGLLESEKIEIDQIVSIPLYSIHLEALQTIKPNQLNWIRLEIK